MTNLLISVFWGHVCSYIAAETVSVVFLFIYFLIEKKMGPPTPPHPQDDEKSGKLETELWSMWCSEIPLVLDAMNGSR